MLVIGERTIEVVRLLAEDIGSSLGLVPRNAEVSTKTGSFPSGRQAEGIRFIHHA